MELYSPPDSNTLTHTHDCSHCNTNYRTFTYGGTDANSTPRLYTATRHNANTDDHKRNPCTCAIYNNAEWPKLAYEHAHQNATENVRAGNFKHSKHARKWSDTHLDAHARRYYQNKFKWEE